MDCQGLPIRVDGVRFMIMRILKGKKRAISVLGKNYIPRFLDRHPHLASKFSSQVKKQRIVASNPLILEPAMIKFGELLKERDIKPGNMYNMDEKAIILGKSARVKVLCVRGRRSPPKMTDGNKELISAIEVVSDDGFVLPSHMVFAGVAQYREWHKQLGEEDKDTVFSYSATGWSNQYIGRDWLIKVFDKHTRPRLKDPQDWRLLIVDGHNSRFTYDFVLYCHENNIEMFCLPSHCTHILQPLDVGLFGPLQHYYGLAAEQHLYTTGDAITKLNFLPLFRNARKKAYTKENITAAFATTGMRPYDITKITSRFSGTAAPDRRSDSIIPQTPQRVQQSSPVIPPTPKDTGAIRQLQIQLKARAAAHEDPELLALIDKLANAGISAQTTAQIQSHRVETLENAMLANKTKPGKGRSALTTEQAVTGAELMKQELALLNAEAPPVKAKRRANAKTAAQPRPKAVPALGIADQPLPLIPDMLETPVAVSSPTASPTNNSSLGHLATPLFLRPDPSIVPSTFCVAQVPPLVHPSPQPLPRILFTSPLLQSPLPSTSLAPPRTTRLRKKTTKLLENEEILEIKAEKISQGRSKGTGRSKAKVAAGEVVDLTSERIE